MAEILTKSRARNIFYGGSIFFVVAFVAMTVHSHRQVVQTSTAGIPLSDDVRHGQHVWEEHSCIDCHSLHGEGAYFAPELANITTRWGVQDSKEDAFFMALLMAWMPLPTASQCAIVVVGLVTEHGETQTVMIEATYLKADRTATTMAAKKGGTVA